MTSRNLIIFMHLHHKLHRAGMVQFLTLMALALLGQSCFAAQEEIEPDLTVSKEYGISRSMVTKLPDYADFKDYREADFAKMSLDDPRLQSVYVRLFVKALGTDSSQWRLEDHVQAALNDLRRRGDAVTPMLLKLMRENQDTHFESAVLSKIYKIDNIDANPYLGYARQVLATRYQTMNSALAGCVAILLVNRGDETDVQRLREAIVKRPYLTATIQAELRVKEYLRTQAASSEAESTKPVATTNPPTAKFYKGKLDDTTESLPDDRQNWSWLRYAIIGTIGFLIVLLVLLKRRFYSGNP